MILSRNVSRFESYISLLLRLSHPRASTSRRPWQFIGKAALLTPSANHIAFLKRSLARSPRSVASWDMNVNQSRGQRLDGTILRTEGGWEFLFLPVQGHRGTNACSGMMNSEDFHSLHMHVYIFIVYIMNYICFSRIMSRRCFEVHAYLRRTCIPENISFGDYVLEIICRLHPEKSRHLLAIEILKLFHPQ